MTTRLSLSRAAMWARDAAAIYGAMVFVLWLSARLVALQGPWIPALTLGLLVYAARKLVLAKYAARAGSDKQAIWFLLACTIAGIAVAVELVVALVHDFEPVFLLVVLLVPYACGLTFYRRRILTRFDLECIRGILHDRFEEI